MYSQFRVQNFRGFKDLELKDLARVNLIAGKNNVGKTSLLEALSILSGKVDIVLARTGFVISNDNLSRGTRHETLKPFAIRFKPNRLFYKFDISSQASIVGTGKDKQPKEYKLRQIDISEVNLSQDSHLLSNKFGVYIDGIELISPEDIRDYILVGDKVIGYQASIRRFPLIISFARQQERFEDIIEWFSELKRKRQISLLVETLKPIEAELINIDLLDTGLHLDIPRLPELIALEEMGDGMVRLTNMILAISAVQDGILLIDEIENGLHYSIQADVWKAIAKAAELFNVQIFATTHSREMIQAAHEAFRGMPENSFRYHRLDRDKTGDIYATTYDEYSMSAAMETEAELR